MRIRTCLFVVFALVVPIHGWCSDAVAEFGVEELPPIATGVFIHQNRYVHRPYVVARRGLSVLINGLVVEEGREWPPYDYAVAADPGDPPPGSSPLDSPGASGRDGYWSRKYRYLMSHLGIAEARKAYAKLIETSPQVDHAELDAAEPDLIDVHFKDGRTVGIELGRNDHDQPTRDEALGDAKGTMRRFATLLEHGDVVGVLPHGEWSVAPRDQRRFFDVLLSDAPAADKIRILADERFVKTTDASLVGALTTFDADGDELYLRFGKVPPSYAGTPAATGRYPGVVPPRAPETKQANAMAAVLVCAIAALFLLVLWLFFRRSR